MAPTPTSALNVENFYATTLSANIGAGTLVIPVTVVPTTTEGYLVISRKSSTLREVIYYNSVDSILKTVTCPSDGRGVSGTAQGHVGGESIAMADVAEYWQALKNGVGFTAGIIKNRDNLLKNGNFINASTNGYGGLPDNWTESGTPNTVQGGFPLLTKQNLIDLLGVADGDIEGLWPLNALVNTDDFDDLSANGYDLDSAGHVPDVGSDGLVGGVLDFEASNTDYGSIADGSCPNLEIAGSQTWFSFIKLESIPGSMSIMSKLKASSLATAHNFAINSAGKALFNLEGLSTAGSNVDVVTSDIILETGKWYMIVGVYDSANSKIKIHVNGVKKEAAATGSAGDSNADFAIGANFNGAADAATDFFDGLIQYCGVLSVALSDDQVKRLWAATTYKGVKTRRAAGTPYIYQDLPQDLVERLRGKKITLNANYYQDTASTATISIDDGTETESTAVATTGSWLEKTVSKTISATATNIRIKLKQAAISGNVWFKEVALYEGGLSVPWQHSKDDWATFPLLLQMNPGATNGYNATGKVLGYAQITSGQTGITTVADITGLSVGVTVPPGGHRVKITGFCRGLSSDVANDSGGLVIREGTTQLAEFLTLHPVINRGVGAFVEYTSVPTAGYHTYKISALREAGTGSISLDAGSTYPAFIKVEIV